jgi:hypothetical protein
MYERVNGSLTPQQLEFQVIYLIGFWMETLLYGMSPMHLSRKPSFIEPHLQGLYFSLFLMALPIFIRSVLERTFSARVFLVGNVIMFLLISMHDCRSAPFFLVLRVIERLTGLGACQLVNAFAYQLNALGTIGWLRNMDNVPVHASVITLAMTIWVGDALVVSRCQARTSSWLTLADIPMLSGLATEVLDHHSSNHPPRL